MANALRPRKLSPKKVEYLALALIMLLAIFLRFYQLDAIPVGIDGDQGADGYGAKRILRGEEYPVYLSNRWGVAPMHTYLVAFSFALWGISLWAIRFASAVVGVLTIPVVFWLAKELFPSKEDSPSWVAILSAFWLATSYWHITFSRAGQDPATLPLLSAAAMYFLWRGVRSGRRWPFLLSGLLLGATLYGYRAARFLPIFPAVLLGYWLVSDKAFRQRHLLDLGLLAMVAALVCSPLAAYAVAHPDIFFARELHVFIIGPEAGGNPFTGFGTALVRTMAMYSFLGDYMLVWNPGRRPVLDPLSSLCFIVGLFVAVRRWRSRSYLLVLLWFLIMALPGAFTLEHLPSFTRGIGALPPMCLLLAIGVISAKDWLETKLLQPRTRRFFWASVSVVLFSTTLLSCRDYFRPWQEHLAKGHVVGKTYIEAAAVMNRTRVPDGVWILPATSLRPPALPFYEVDFLYNGPEPEYTVYVDENTAPEELSEICQGHRQAAVINWKWYVLEEAYTSWDSDPKGLLDFLFRKYGRRIQEEPFESFDLVTYELPEYPDFAIADAFESAEANFGEELRLAGVALGGSSLNATSTADDVERNVLPSGKEAWVVLRWRALQVPTTNYGVAVYLLDGHRRLAGQVDRLLLSNHLQPTSGWSAGQSEIDYYMLPSLPATPPGEYAVEVAVYDPETMQRLAVFDEREGTTKTSLPVGSLQVVEPLLPAQIEPTDLVAVAVRDIAPGIRLLGYDLPVRVVGPGGTASVALYWQALEDLDQDYLLSLQVRDPEGQVRLERKGRPVDDTYPTTEWDQDEVLRDWHDLALPAHMQQGEYEIFVSVLRGEELMGEAPLGRLQVEGRARQFTIPDIQYPWQATLGEGVRFLGYDLSSDSVKPGQALHLRLYWQALEAMQTSYTVFTHLVDTEEHIWGQNDNIPGSGALPTTSWIQGEVIADEYEIVVDPEAPPGEYSIETGMYDASTGQRLPAYGSDGSPQGDRILLQPVRLLAGE